MRPPDSLSVPQTDPMLLALSVISLLEGAWARHLITNRDEAIGAALTAALSLAIDSHGAGHEEDALIRTDAIFQHLLAEYRSHIAEGSLTGRTRGGFERGR